MRGGRCTDGKVGSVQASSFVIAAIVVAAAVLVPAGTSTADTPPGTSTTSVETPTTLGVSTSTTPSTTPASSTTSQPRPAPTDGIPPAGPGHEGRDQGRTLQAARAASPERGSRLPLAGSGVDVGPASTNMVSGARAPAGEGAVAARSILPAGHASKYAAAIEETDGSTGHWKLHGAGDLDDSSAGGHDARVRSDTSRRCDSNHPCRRGRHPVWI